jgi:hypothetical protein
MLPVRTWIVWKVLEQLYIYCTDGVGVSGHTNHQHETLTRGGHYAAAALTEHVA